MITRRKFIAGSAAVTAGSALAGPVGFRLPGAFTPRSIPNLKLWLDASQITGLNDGDAVTTWSDLSGNGNDATQATGSKKPTYETSVVNGRPVVRGDGVDDVMFSTGATPTDGQPITVCVVTTVRAVTAFGYLFSGKASFGVAAYVNDSFSVNFSSTAYAGASLSLAGATAYGTMGLMTFVYDGANSETYKNGVSSSSGDAGANAAAGLTLFNRYDEALPTPADVAEFVLYAGDLRGANLTALHAYFMAKYGL